MQEVATVPAVTEGMILEVVRCIVDGFDPDKVVLFGSHAYGDPRPESDLDLLVIMDSRERVVERSVRVVQSCRPRGVAMDVLVRTPRELSERLAVGDPFFCEVIARGRVLYERPIR